MKHLPSTLLLLGLAATLHAAEPHPDILLILADDLGYGDVGAFNPDSKIPTPHLDKLAAEGMRFTDAHAGGSVCVPSRYALMTGRFAARPKPHARSGTQIEDGRATIASLLRDHGYTTSMIGKWHLGFLKPEEKTKQRFDYTQPLRGGPLDRGFDEFFGMHASLDIPPYFFIRGRSPTSPPGGTIEARTSVGHADQWTNIQGEFWRAGPVAPDFKHAEVTPRFADEADKVIRNHAAKRGDKPLFLYLALPSPHTPWLPLEEFRGKSGAGMYGDFVMQVDAVVGRLMRTLEETGLADGSLVIFSSDNGPVWYEKDVERFGHDSTGGLRGRKASSWEGGHRMPFIARWPGNIAPGTTCGQTIAFCDLFATFAELVGVKQIPDGAAEDSVTFLPWLLDPNRQPGRRPPIVHDQWTLRDGDWKLILPRNKRKLGGGRAEKLSAELFNLRQDRNETTNRIKDEPERAEILKTRLNSILAR